VNDVACFAKDALMKIGIVNDFTIGFVIKLDALVEVDLFGRAIVGPRVAGFASLTSIHPFIIGSSLVAVGNLDAGGDVFT
jgi:hypothetical protein